MKISFVFLCIFFLLFIIPGKILAVTITINKFPQVITSDEFAIDTTITGAKEGINYLRIDLYKENTKNYFGETWNGTEWYGGSKALSYPKIAISKDSPTSVNMKGRVGSPSATDYPSAGLYKLKVRRYTASGNVASNDQIIPVDVQIAISTPDPLLTPTPFPTDFPPPGQSPPSLPSPVPSSVILGLETTSPTSTPSSAPWPTTDPALPGTQPPSPVSEVINSNKGSILGLFLILGGMILIVAAGFLFLGRKHNI